MAVQDIRIKGIGIKGIGIKGIQRARNITLKKRTGVEGMVIRLHRMFRKQVMK